MESMILYNTSIQKQYQKYLIKLSSNSDLINILIEKDNTIYESNFNLQSLHQHQLLKSLTSQKIINFIIELIDINKIEKWSILNGINVNKKKSGIMILKAIDNSNEIE